MGRDLNIMYSKKSDEWCTPIDFFNKLNKEFNFTLDPCASDDNHLCDTYFTIKDNGLDKSWDNHIVFCNPPYSKIKSWAFKCFIESLHGTKIVLLIPARTDTHYFHDYILPYAKIRFIRGRLKFSNKGSAPFPSILCIYN